MPTLGWSTRAWTGGEYGAGSRIKLSYTRAIIDAISQRRLNDAQYVVDPFFGLSMPSVCPGCPSEILNPQKTWANSENYQHVAQKLVQLFRTNFELYAEQASQETKMAGPIFELPAEVVFN